MGFRPCVDFFRKDRKILLTKEGIDKVSRIKLTGTKIPKFFKLKLIAPDEEEDELSEADILEGKGAPETPFQIWSNIFNFPFIKKRNPRKQENYRVVEETIKSYLEGQFSRIWINYPLDRYDVFEFDSIFGGVPDGEERDSKEKVVSILEIKTITDIQNRKNNDRFEKVPISYQLQLALYLFLRGIDTGYICICYLKEDNWENPKSISLKSSLSHYSMKPIKFSGSLDSWIPDIGECEYEFELLESYCNNFLEDNEILVFKLKINLDKYKKILDKLESWFLNHQTSSPDMNDNELLRYINRNKKW